MNSFPLASLNKRQVFFVKKAFSLTLFVSLLFQPLTPAFLTSGFFIPKAHAQEIEEGTATSADTPDESSEGEEAEAPQEAEEVASVESEEESTPVSSDEAEESVEEAVLEETNETSTEETASEKEEVKVEAKDWAVSEDDKKATLEMVALNVKYTAPQNSDVTVTFTKLPETAGTLVIEEITLTKEQIEATGALSDKAYDITSSMENGSFEYELSLPIPEGAEDVKIKYADSASELSNAKTVDASDVKTEDDSVKAELNHFTVFIITDDSAAYVGSWVDYATQGYQNTGVHYPTTLSAGDTATWDFSPISGVRKVYVSWSTDPNRTTTAPYTLNHVGGSTTFPINQELLADQGITGAPGEWSGWHYLGTVTLDGSSNLVLTGVNNASGTDYVIADEVALVSLDDIWVDDNWAGMDPGEEIDSNKIFGGNAFATIQEGVDVAEAGAVIHVMAGNYVESVSVTKSVNLRGFNANISPNGGDRAAEAVIQATNQAAITVNAANVTINGFSMSTVRPSSAAFGIVVKSGGSSAQIKNNIIDTVTTSDTSGNGTAQAIYLEGGPDNVQVLTNKINNIHSNRSAKGVLIGDNNTSNPSTGVLIQSNAITNVVSETKGAYGVSAANVTPGHSNLQIKDNTISTLSSGTGWVHALGLEGSTPNAIVTGNTISNLTGPVTSTDVVGVHFESNTGVNTVTLTGNTFMNTRYDIQNRVSGTTADARGNTWSVMNQTNLNQIESAINQNCTNSPYVHGTCNPGAGDDVSYGFVKYAEIGIPTNLGWNVHSKSATPDETSYDFACSISGIYTNENSVAQNWSVVSGANIKYQRQVTYPSGSVSLSNAGSNNYTPFVTFGSSTGIEGLWKTKVRAYVDANNNNIVDFGEEISDFSNPCNITYDVTAPDTTILTGPSGLVSSTSASFIFSSPDSTATFECQIDGGGFSACTTPKTYTGLSQGAHTFEVRAKDLATNVDPTPATRTWTIDTIAPDVAITAPTGGYVNGIVAIHGSVTDANPHHYYLVIKNPSNAVIAGPEQVNDTTSFTGKLLYNWNTVGLPDGVYTIQLEARDAANNKDAGSFTTQTVTIDNTKPTVGLVFPTAMIGSNSANSFQAVFSEDVKEVEAKNGANYFLTNWPGADGSGDLNGDVSITYNSGTKTATITMTNPGWYVSAEQTWGVKNINDLAGNLQAVNPYSEISTPNLAPVTADSGTDINWHNAPVTVTLTCNDGPTTTGSGCKTTYYTTNGSTPTTGSAQGNSVVVSAEGVTTIKYFSVDKAGNAEVVKSAAHTVKIDTTFPESTITTYGSSPAPVDKGTVNTPTWDGTVAGTATDGSGSGVNHVNLVIKRNLFSSPSANEYWNGLAWQPTEVKVVATNTTSWTYALPTPEQGIYTISSHAVDNAGNEESTYTITIIYDKTIPEVTLAIDPGTPNGDNNWYDSLPVISLTAADNNTTNYIEYQLNGISGAWTPYSGPVTLQNGTWQFYYRAVDTTGNVSGVGLKNVKVDTNNPDEVDNLDAEYRADRDDIKLDWDVNDDDIDQVFIYRGGSRTFNTNSGNRIGENDANDETLNDGDVELGETYYYKLVSVDEAGNRSGANVIRVEMPAAAGGVATVTTLGVEPDSGDDGTVLGAETNATEESQEEQGNNEEGTSNNAGDQGQVLGATDENGNGNVLADYVKNHPWLSALWVLILLALGYKGYQYWAAKKQNPIR